MVSKCVFPKGQNTNINEMWVGISVESETSYISMEDPCTHCSINGFIIIHVNIVLEGTQSRYVPLFIQW